MDKKLTAVETLEALQEQLSILTEDSAVYRDRNLRKKLSSYLSITNLLADNDCRLTARQIYEFIQEEFGQ